MNSARVSGSRWICWSETTGCRKRCGWRRKKIETRLPRRITRRGWERRGEGRMNPKIEICLVLSGALVLSAAAVQAQRHGPDGPPFGAPMELMGFEGMHGGRVVKGAPFSATATSETTSTLQDGSVLHRTSQVSVYRDSQGRSRHEATFTGFGPLTASGGAKKMVMISDPVAGVHIMLDDQQKVAHKTALRTRGGSAADAKSAPAFEGKM